MDERPSPDAERLPGPGGTRRQRKTTRSWPPSATPCSRRSARTTCGSARRALVAGGAFVAACVARPDGDGSLKLAAGAGTAQAYLANLKLRLDDSPRSPPDLAWVTREPCLEPDLRGASWLADDRSPAVGSMLAVPGFTRRCTPAAIRRRRAPGSRSGSSPAPGRKRRPSETASRGRYRNLQARPGNAVACAARDGCRSIPARPAQCSRRPPWRNDPTSSWRATALPSPHPGRRPSAGWDARSLACFGARA